MRRVEDREGLKKGFCNIYALTKGNTSQLYIFLECQMQFFFLISTDCSIKLLEKKHASNYIFNTIIDHLVQKIHANIGRNYEKRKEGIS